MKYITLLFIITTMTLNAEVSQISLKTNCDIPGGNLKSLKGKTAATCKDECELNKSCKGFTYISGWNRCFLKKKVSKQVTLRITSGYLDENRKPKIMKDTDFKGHDLKSLNGIKSAKECAQKCKTTNECIGFAYLDGYNTCWVKDEIKIETAHKKIFYCGVKN
jgi:hypothetical protein